jgi:hypothetical protein
MLANYSSVDYAHRSSGWLLLDAAETLFVTARRRLFNSNKGISLFSNAYRNTSININIYNLT